MMVVNKDKGNHCACGCGGLTNNYNKFIHGHTNKGRHFSEEHKGKISLANKGSFTVKCGWWAGRKILILLNEHNALCAFRTGFNEIVLTIRGNDTEHQIYKLLLQNGARGISMTSGMFN